MQNVPENDESSVNNVPLNQNDVHGPLKMVGGREDKVGGFSAEERLGTKDTREVMLGEPKAPEKEYSVTSILKELAAIQQQGPQKYCVLGTRHCSFLHQQIIELLAYALVLSGNHVFTSGAGGTHAGKCAQNGGKKLICWECGKYINDPTCIYTCELIYCL